MTDGLEITMKGYKKKPTPSPSSGSGTTKFLALLDPNFMARKAPQTIFGRQKDAFLLIKSNVVSAYKTNSSKILCSVIRTNAQKDQENENSGVPHF